MKRITSITALLLVLAMLALWLPAGAFPVMAAAGDYISATYAANLSVKTTEVTSLMSCPCTASVTGDSTVVAGIDAGTMLTVSALHKNTKGEYWYKVLYYGKTCYVQGSATTLVDHLTGDVAAANILAPAALSYGDSFPIQGTVTASVNQLGKVTAAMYKGSNITGAPVISASDTAANNTYTLDSSTIDYNLAFGALSPGVHTYLLSAEAISYYIDDNDALATSTQTVALYRRSCVVTDVDNPNPATAHGVDVSEWNGDINWATLKNEVDFAILRLGWEYTLDLNFTEYAQGCTDYGVPFGVYHYSYAETEAEAIAEAEFVLSVVKNYDLALPIWFDFEDECQLWLSASLKDAIVKAFCNTVSAAGYDVGLYTFTSWFTDYLDTPYYKSLPMWVAQIDGFTSNGTCSYDGGLHMWQYSWKGRFSGINGGASDVDCNYYYGEFLGQSVDSSYLSQCTYYPANMDVTTNDRVNLRQYPTAAPTISSSCAAGTKVYDLDGSQVDYNLSFNALGQGYYTYEISADVKNYYINSSGSLTSQTENVVVWKAPFTVGNATVTPPTTTHTHTVVTDAAVAATCTETGLTAGTYCADCGVTISGQTVIPATGHTIGILSRVEPTCATTGLTAGSYCSVCGQTLAAQTTIPATGHTAGTPVKENEIPGVSYEQVVYCSVCGAEMSRTTVSTAMTFLGASLSLAGDIGLNYYVKLESSLVSDANTRMEFSYANKTQTVPLSSAQATVYNGTACYVFTCKLQSVDMADVVTAQLYSSEGAVGGSRDYGVKMYCDNVFAYVDANGSATPASILKVVPLLKAMLNYGACAQLQFTGDSAGALANVDLSAADKTLPTAYDVSAYAPRCTGTEDGIQAMGASLVLDTTTTIRFFFKLTGSKSIGAYAFTVNGKAVKPVANGSQYYVEMVGVTSANLDVTYTVQVGGLTVSYSGLSYVYQVKSYSGSAVSLQNLAAALYAYNREANSYFG